MDIRNHRLAGESATSYRHRRREVNKLIARYLRVGTPATHSRDKSSFSERKGPGPEPSRKYVNGPHRSHGPHGVKAEGFILSPLGVPTPHMFKVMHPGTLVKA